MPWRAHCSRSSPIGLGRARWPWRVTAGWRPTSRRRSRRSGWRRSTGGCSRRPQPSRSVGGVVARVAAAEALPQRQLLPARLACPPLLVVEPRVREEAGDHLLAEAVPEADPPPAGRALARVGGAERGARAPPENPLLTSGPPPPPAP